MPLRAAMPSSEQALRQEIIEVCRLLHRQGYLAASDGNVSAKLPDGNLLMTPSGVAKAFIEPSDLVVVDSRGVQVSGELKPSGELAMHLAVFNVRPDAKVVIHAHPPTCVAVSMFKNLRLNGVLPELILTFGQIEIVPYARALTEALARAVGHSMQNRDAVILERHGTVAMGTCMLEAFGRTERLEHACEILWRAHAIARPGPLPEQEIRTLNQIHDSSRTASR